VGDLHLHPVEDEPGLAHELVVDHHGTHLAFAPELANRLGPDADAVAECLLALALQELQGLHLLQQHRVGLSALLNQVVIVRIHVELLVLDLNQLGL